MVAKIKHSICQKVNESLKRGENRKLGKRKKEKVSSKTKMHLHP